MSEHPQDQLELYALGTLEDAERDAVEAHLAGCEACCAHVERLQDVALALGPAWPVAAAVTPIGAARLRAIAPWLPTAAAVLLAVGAGGGWYADHQHGAAIVARDDAALSTVAKSHFLHASFTASDPTLPAAKALYARDASWTLVIVDAARPDLHVRASLATSDRDLGSLEERGTTSMLYASLPGGVRALSLVDASGKTVATVNLVLPATPPIR